MPDTNMIAADPGRLAVGSLPAVGALPLANAWQPTAAEAATLDTLAVTVGSARCRVTWSTGACDDGTRTVCLTMELPVDWPMDAHVGSLVQRADGLWAVVDDDEPEAGTLPALAETLADLWGGPGRWKLASEQAAGRVA